MSNGNQLVQRLVEVQHLMGEIDQQFAERLGATRSTWSLIRSDKRNFGLKTMVHIALNFPALERYILAYLRELAQTHKPYKPYTTLTNPTNHPANQKSIMAKLR
jgi:hypothetical protein